MRTQEQILNRIEEIKDSDIFGTEVEDLVNYLEYDNVKQFLKEGVTNEEWDKDKKSNDEEVLKEMKDYIEFAWEKALGERGLSSERSLMHFSAWIWLLDDGNFEEFENRKSNDFAIYGRPVLSWICKKYNLKKEVSE